MIRPLREDDLDAVRALWKAAHPSWPVPVPEWFIAHPTLVMEGRARLLDGYTSFSVAPGVLESLEGMVMYGADVAVHPLSQGQGIGRALHRARLDLARKAGAVAFVGMTQPDNRPMVLVFERAGATRGLRIPNYYPDGQDGVIYSGPTEVV